MRRLPTLPTRRLLAAVLVVLASGCGDDGSASSDTAAPVETAEATIEFSDEFCTAFGDPVWVEFNTAEQRTDEQAAQLEALSAALVASAPEELADEVAVIDDGTAALLAVWRAAEFDSAMVDTAALTDLSTTAADSVHRVEGLAEQGCDIPRGFGGLFATG